MQIEQGLGFDQALEQGADQARLEMAQALHHDQGRRQSLTIGGAAGRAGEQPAALDGGILDLQIAGHLVTVVHSQVLGGLAFGEREVADAVVQHDARRFLRQFLADARRGAHQNTSSGC